MLCANKEKKINKIDFLIWGALKVGILNRKNMFYVKKDPKKKKKLQELMHGVIFVVLFCFRVANGNALTIRL